MNLKGKTILITGATGGIGSVLCSHLSHTGAHLFLVGRNPDKLQSLLDNLEEPKHHHLFPTDLTNEKHLRQLVTKISHLTKTLDVVVHAAGIGIYKAFEDITQKDWHDSLALNLEAPYFLTQALLPLLTNSSSSLVLTIGSGAGVIPMRGRSLYCTSKFALRGAMLSLAEEFRGTPPHFTLITLGSTLTPFGPLSLEKKQEEALQGKAYFTPEWVTNKLIEIIKNDQRESEYTLYPGDYGFGTWSRP